ncbi:hypothetical protein ACFQ3P_37490 [Paraburkholderia sabiae]|uniref:DUF2254 domain-containing protein n=1 Tax=Paraburkholderia sabiae TaxID=273251 RepID=A0ABU9QQS1_9BURK|nr:hypothetical protein [Paraburkholderia sabiae]WJZ72308.1 hypothetical protein QEN71_19285 [Paraburkholderia sabiae]CAD6537926.1 hypothetical protein LMG24235_03275 [Paraburkholderia sabiae]
MRAFTQSVTQALFDRGGLKAAFEHVRNLVIATVLVAAGFETIKRFDVIDFPGLSNPRFAGYVVAGIGCALIVLNLLAGLRQLSRLRWHFALQTALTIIYMVFSLRMVQLIILFRTNSCQ